MIEMLTLWVLLISMFLLAKIECKCPRCQGTGQFSKIEGKCRRCDGSGLAG
jgi:DnaJ-class molecular chaperone